MKGVGRVDALVSQCLSVPLKKMVSKSHNPEPRRPTLGLGVHVLACGGRGCALNLTSCLLQDDADGVKPALPCPTSPMIARANRLRHLETEGARHSEP